MFKVDWRRWFDIGGGFKVVENDVGLWGNGACWVGSTRSCSTQCVCIRRHSFAWGGPGLLVAYCRKAMAETTTIWLSPCVQKHVAAHYQRHGVGQTVACRFLVSAKTIQIFTRYAPSGSPTTWSPLPEIHRHGGNVFGN